MASEGLIRSIKQRRDEIHREIDDLRSKLAVLEARAADVEAILKDALAAEPTQQGAPIVAPQKVARGASHARPRVADLIVAALKELEGAGFEAAERAAILKIVLRSAPKTKDNTFRVMLKRLTAGKQAQIERMGNLYRLRGTEAA